MRERTHVPYLLGRLASPCCVDARSGTFFFFSQSASVIYIATMQTLFLVSGRECIVCHLIKSLNKVSAQILMTSLHASTAINRAVLPTQFHSIRLGLTQDMIFKQLPKLIHTGFTSIC